MYAQVSGHHGGELWTRRDGVGGVGPLLVTVGSVYGAGCVVVRVKSCVKGLQEINKVM